MDLLKLTKEPALLGEGPCWHEAEQVLYWIDILGKRLHCYDPKDDISRSWEFDEMIGTVAPRCDGGVLLALQNGFAFFDPDTETLDRLAPVDENPRTRFNDGKCYPQGRFWCGTMDVEEKESIGALYRMNADHQVSQWDTAIGVSNGMTWSQDGRTMYYIDSPTRNIYAYDVDPSCGDITNRRIAFQLTPEEGFPEEAR